MGMYTAIHFYSELKKDVPNEVIEILEYMLDFDNKPEPKLPDHPLFKTERWRFMLVCDSYYFDEDTYSALRLDHSGSYLLDRINRLQQSGIIHVMDCNTYEEIDRIMA